MLFSCIINKIREKADDSCRSKEKKVIPLMLCLSPVFSPLIFVSEIEKEKEAYQDAIKRALYLSLCFFFFWQEFS